MDQFIWVRPVRRLVLRPGRPRLLDGLRDHQTTQLRPRRPLHARRVRRLHRAHLVAGALGVRFVALLVVMVSHGRDRYRRRGHRAGRLSSVARCAAGCRSSSPPSARASRSSTASRSPGPESAGVPDRRRRRRPARPRSSGHLPAMALTRSPSCSCSPSTPWCGASSGRAMRAIALDPRACLLMGVDVEPGRLATFFLGSALAGAAGVMAGAYYGKIDFLMGFAIGLKAFTAAVIGGIGNLRGRHARWRSCSACWSRSASHLGGRVAGRLRVRLPHPLPDRAPHRAAR